MIILDTNVVSELWKPIPDRKVLSWLDRQAKERLHLSAVSEAEILYGLHLLAPGKRRNQLEKFFEREVLGTLSGEILAFDSAAAKAYGVLAAVKRAAGRPMPQADAMIAAIAVVHGATLATRNTKDFRDCGIELVNPWEP